MKKWLTAGLLLLGLNATGQSDLFTDWAVPFNGGGNMSVLTDSVGNVWTFGIFNPGTVDFDPGAGNVSLTNAGPVGNSCGYITKHSPNGTLLWVKKYGEGANVTTGMIKIRKNDVFVVGTFTQSGDFDPGVGTTTLTQTGASGADMFILKLTGTGNLVLARNIGGDNNCWARDFYVDDVGRPIIGGTFWGTVDFDPNAGASNLTGAFGVGFSDCFVVKLDNTLNFMWAKRFGGNGNEELYGLDVDGNDNIITVGKFELTVDFDPNPGVSQMTATAGTNTAFINKLNSSGAYVWSKKLASANPTTAQKVAIDANDNIYTIGYFSGSVNMDPNGSAIVNGNGSSVDMFISKLSPLGNYVWGQGFGGSGSAEYITGMDFDIYDHLVFQGYYLGTINIFSNTHTAVGGTWGDMYAFNMTQAGTFISSRSYGDAGRTQTTIGDGLAASVDGAIYVIGTTQGFDDFKTGLVPKVVNSGASTWPWIVKLFPCPSDTTVVTTAACDSYTMNAQTYTTSGTYYQTLSNINGCDSVVRLNLTVNTTPVLSTAVSSNSPVCSGNMIQLTAPSIAGSTYSWTGPNGFTSGIQNPTISNAVAANAGVYSVTVTRNGCSSAASANSSVNVVVNPTPQLTTPVTSNSPVCSGNNIQLQAETIAGATYSWTGPNGFTSSSEDPVISAATTAASGMYNLTVTVNGCSSLPSANSATAVVVNQTPALSTAISSNTPVCSGNNIQLQAETIAGATYSWTGPNGFTSSSEDPVISAATTAASGTYNLTVTVNGCSSLPDANSATAVVVNQTPALSTAISSNTPVCSGNNIQLQAETIAGATYSWTGPNGFASSSEDPVISAATTAASGMYNLTVTVNGCSSLPDANSATAVVVNQTPQLTTPVTSNSPVCSGNNIQLQAETIAGATYSWTGPNGFTSSSEDPVISTATTAASGTYNLTVTVNGCSSLPDANSATAVVVNQTPALSTAISSNTPVCSGNNIQLQAETIAGATYSWTGPNGFTSSSEDPVISAATTAASGTYNLTVTVNGCSSLPDANSATAVVVNQTPALSTAISSNTPVCSGNDIQLQAETIAGATYSWTGPNGFASSIEDPVISAATTAASGTYNLTVTVNGCSSLPDANSATAVVVNQTPALASAVSSNTPVCSGNNVLLFAPNIAGATYSWSGPNGFTSSIEDPVISAATTAASGTYNLTVTVNGCSSLPSANSATAVVVNQTPALSTAISSNTPVCSGNDIQLQAETIAGATYSWTGPNGFTSSSEDPVISAATTAASGTYNLTVTVNGCSSLSDANSSTAVLVNSLPVLTLEDTIDACGQAQYIYSVPGFDAYQWSTGGTSYEEVITQNGNYVLTVELDGCFATDSSYVHVGAYDAGDGAFADGPASICPEEDFSFYAVGGSSVTWTGPAGFNSSQWYNTIQDVSAANSGIYTVTIFYANGCEQSESVSLQVLSEEECLDIPEIVTPNGDGLNDFYVLEFLSNYPDNSVKIFNRWGNEVFGAAPYNSDWNGQTNRGVVLNNNKLPVGTYFVLIDLGNKVVKATVELNY